ncbi:MAG TPA: hypothetical protein VE972_05820 [Conexibacter sp.]|nr:hypothetical protein [Conexibacter sp.]
MKKDDYNLEAFKSIRDEINRRIEIHYRVVLTKYVLVGSLFAYLVTHRSAYAHVSPFEVASAFAFILDVIVLENLGWIRSAGSFIRNTIETTPIEIVKWETRGAQPDNRWTCFTTQGYVLGSWSIGVILLIGAAVTNQGRLTGASVFGFIATMYLLVYSLYLIFHHLGADRAPINPYASPVVDTAIVPEAEMRVTRTDMGADGMPREPTPPQSA